MNQLFEHFQHYLLEEKVRPIDVVLLSLATYLLIWVILNILKRFQLRKLLLTIRHFHRKHVKGRLTFKEAFELHKKKKLGKTLNWLEKRQFKALQSNSNYKKKEMTGK